MMACKVFRTANTFCYWTVAVNFGGVRDAVHVGLKNKAISLHPRFLGETNLSGDPAVRAVKSSRAGDVDQRFRFLNKKLSFVKSFQQEGLAFSRLAPRAIEVMG